MSSFGGGLRRGGTSGGWGDTGRKPFNDRSYGGNSYDDMNEDKPTKIVLLNAASDMQMDAVRKWCSQYGSVTNMRFINTQSDKKIFFVDYCSFAEAEKALRSINESNPFNIKCEFSKQKEGITNKPSERESNQRDSNQRDSNQRDFNQRNGPSTQNERHNEHRSENRLNNSSYTRNDNDDRQGHRQNGGLNSRSNFQTRQKPVVHEPVNFAPKISQNTNQLPNGQTNFLTKFNKVSSQQPSISSSKWNNAQLASTTTKVTSDKTTTVSTPKFKEPESSPSTIANSPAPAKKGACVNCSKESKFLCERCKCFYCSHECQAEDWPFHKAVCNELPRLIPLKINHTKNFKILDATRPTNEIKVPPIKPAVDSSSTVDKNISTPVASKPEVEPKIVSKIPVVPDDHPNKKEIDKIDDYYSKQIEIDRTLANQSSGIAFKINQFAQNLPKRLPIPEEPKPQPVVASSLHIFGEFPKSRTAVVITAVLSPDVVYIRSSAGKENASYCKLLQDVYSYAAGAKNLMKLPNKGDMVLADYQGTYNRALILKAEHKQEIHIAYLDFGNVDIKRLDELKMIDTELQRIPRYTFRVCLKGVFKTSMPEDGLKYLNQLCDDIAELEIRYEIQDVADKEKKCELFDPTASVMVNKRLVELMEIKPPTEDDKIVMIENIQVRNMPPGKKVKVVIRDNSLLQVGCISVATADCEIDMKALNAEINRYCKGLKISQPYTPRINEACLVYLHEDDLWVRAICIETVGNGNPKMQLVDIGSFVDINIKHIRRIPAKLAKVPCCAIQTYLKNLPFPLSEAQVAKVKEIFPKNELIVVDEVEVDDGNPEDGEQNNVITVQKLSEYFA